MNGENTGRAFPDHHGTGPVAGVISQLLDGSYREREQPERPREPQAPGDAASRRLPNPSDPYRAYGHDAGQMLPTLFLLLADGTRQGFPYGGLVGGPDLVEASGGFVIVLRVSDVVPMEVTLAGRNLEDITRHLAIARPRGCEPCRPAR